MHALLFLVLRIQEEQKVVGLENLGQPSGRDFMTCLSATLLGNTQNLQGVWKIVPA